MKILVLGNGFDLDHDLPTSYIQFLRFCNCVLDIENEELDDYKKLTDKQLNYINQLKKNKEAKELFISYIKNNRFLTYFNNRIDKLGINWIDFEREIKGIVGEFRGIENELAHQNNCSYFADVNHKIHQVIKELGLQNMDRDQWGEIELAVIHKDLSYAFSKFSLALEYYISTFINNTPVIGVAPDIIDFDADKVLTFNYSEVYENVYGGGKRKEDIEHIHGTAFADSKNGARIILGITSVENNNSNCYVEFEKYFQRITKKTGSEYKKWLSAVSEKEEVEVAFFGHSLDSSDSDIIKDFIFDQKVNITIYYYNETAYETIVANLVEIIGKEKLIQFVSGVFPRIRFVRQAEHQNDNTSGIEITNDIRDIYRLYLLSDDQIMELLDKVKRKIEEKEKGYFYSQRKTISLFEALKTRKISFANETVFYNICKGLTYERSKTGKLRYYTTDEWEDYRPWNETIECDVETAKLINRVNKYNEKKYQKDQNSFKYEYVAKFTKVEDIMKAMLIIFEEKNPSSEYWEDLSKLVNAIGESELMNKALRLILKEDLPLPTRVKAEHFEEMFTENWFYLQEGRLLAERYKDEIDMDYC